MPKIVSQTTFAKHACRLRHSKRSGAVIPLVAVVLVALIVVGGIAFDSARLQLVKSELRAVADCVSRSVSNELIATDSTDMARRRGKEIASTFSVGCKPYLIDDSDMIFGRVTLDKQGNSTFIAGRTPSNAVQVLARRTTNSSSGAISMTFGSMFGVDSGQVVSSAIAGFQCVDICFVLDRSTSMKFDTNENALGMSFSDRRFMLPPSSSSRWQALDRSVDAFLDALNTDNGTMKIAICTYGSDFNYGGHAWPATKRDIDLTTNKDLAKNAMTKLSTSLWNGNTYIEAGMRDGIASLFGKGSRSNAEKVMIVLTDGVQNVGECRNAATDAAAQGITIHTISFSDYANKQTMIDVARIGNGTYAHADDEIGLRNIMTSLASNMTALVQ